MTEDSCAIYRAEGLRNGFKYQVFAKGQAISPVREFAARTHPEYGIFIVATKTEREARKAAQEWLAGRQAPTTPQLVAVIS